MSGKINTFFIGAGLGLVLGGFAEHCFINQIPQTSKVQPGYVIPTNLEIKLQDLNGDGREEVLMSYEKKTIC